MIPLPASIICPARDWSSLEWGSFASIRSAQMSASSMAARVRMAENFSIPTSRLPGFLRPAVSRISIVWPLNLIRMRLMSRVVPCLELTMACCFWPSRLKRLDFPTFGRPMRANLIKGLPFSSRLILDSSAVSALGVIFSSSKIWCLRAEIPKPVVAEVLKISVSLIPNLRYSKGSRDSLRSDLLRIRKTGFFDFSAEREISRSRKSGYLVESTVTRMRSATSMASSI